MTPQKEVLENQVIWEGYTYLKMPFFALPELVDNRTTYCYYVTSACMWKYIHDFS